MSLLDTRFLRDKKKRLITREVPHSEVQAGDFLLTSYGLCEVNGKTTREDGWIVYTLERQSPYSLHPSNWPDIAILADPS